MLLDVTSQWQVNEKGETVQRLRLDPFDHVTIASACQAINRELFLEEEYETYLTDRITKETTKHPTKFDNGVKQIQLPDGDWVRKEAICLYITLERPYSSRVPSPSFLRKVTITTRSVKLQFVGWNGSWKRTEGMVSHSTLNTHYTEVNTEYLERGTD